MPRPTLQTLLVRQTIQVTPQNLVQISKPTLLAEEVQARHHGPLSTQSSVTLQLQQIETGRVPQTLMLVARPHARRRQVDRIALPRSHLKLQVRVRMATDRSLIMPVTLITTCSFLPLPLAHRQIQQLQHRDLQLRHSIRIATIDSRQALETSCVDLGKAATSLDRPHLLATPITINSEEKVAMEAVLSASQRAQEMALLSAAHSVALANYKTATMVVLKTEQACSAQVLQLQGQHLLATYSRDATSRRLHRQLRLSKRLVSRCSTSR